HDPEVVRRNQEELEEYWRKVHREVAVSSTNASVQPFTFQVFAARDGKIATCRVKVSPRNSAETNGFAEHHFTGTLIISNSLDGLIFESLIHGELGQGLSVKGDEYLPALSFVFTVADKLVQSSSLTVTVSPASKIPSKSDEPRIYHYRVDIASFLNRQREGQNLLKGAGGDALINRAKLNDISAK